MLRTQAGPEPCPLEHAANGASAARVCEAALSRHLLPQIPFQGMEVELGIFLLGVLTVAQKECSPRMLARVALAGQSNFLLHVWNERNSRWHESHVYVADGPLHHRLLVPAVHQWVHMNGAADAGLVCYVDKNETGLNRIFVMNPLTRVVKEVPYLNLLTSSNLTMMRIVVDCNTHRCKVIGVKHGPPVEAEVYDSEIRLWTKPSPSLGRIFGIAHHWSRYQRIWRVHKSGPCAYDCCDGKCYHFRQDRKKPLTSEVIMFTVMKDRLFILYRKKHKNEAFVSEYCVPKNATSWVKEKTHSCFPQFIWKPYVREDMCKLHACGDFLFVFILKTKEGQLVEADPH